MARLANLWGWLPAFRAVAETQHLPTASRILHVSPSALSRSIRLLEERMGQRLFRRGGGHLELNDDGERLLAAVRDGFRRIEDGVAAVTPDRAAAHLTVSVTGPLASTRVAAAIDRLARAAPALCVELRAVPTIAVAASLLRGELDLAVFDEPASHARLRVEVLARLPRGVYCGPGHALREVGQPSLAEILACAFVAPPSTPAGACPDGWPVERPRAVAAVVEHVSLAAEVCARGALLAVLPDHIQDTPVGATLRRLPVDVVPPATLYAMARPRLAALASDRVEPFLEGLRG